MATEGLRWSVVDPSGDVHYYRTRARMRAASPGGKRAGYVRSEYGERRERRFRLPNPEILTGILQTLPSRDDTTMANRLLALQALAVNNGDYVAAGRFQRGYEAVIEHAVGGSSYESYVDYMSDLYDWYVDSDYYDEDTLDEWHYHGTE